MSFNYGTHIENPTQRNPIPGKEARMKQNADGAYVFKLDKWARLNRFLILGTEGGTYYASEKSLTLENAQGAIDCIREDGIRVVAELVKVSDEGRAPKNDAAIFVLALCVAKGNDATRRAAYFSLPLVCRIGTHVFNFMNAIKAVGKGSSRGLRNALKGYYEAKNDHRFALDLLKYKGRNGWTHRDIFRMIRWTPEGDKQSTMKYYMTGFLDNKKNPLTFGEFECRTLFEEGKEALAIEVIKEKRLPRELVPTELYSKKKTWEAMLPSMPYTALMRNLGKITQMGLLGDFSEWETVVCEKLRDEIAIRNSRAHPMNIMTAWYTYRKGKGFKGNLIWSPNQRVLAALENAFYSSFKYVEPMGVKTVIALDVSSSMDWESTGTLTAREAACGMALSLIKTEPYAATYAFSDQLTKLDVNEHTTLDQFLGKVNNLPFRSTNCALPIEMALEHKVPADLFVILTDNETNGYRSGHVDTYLKRFREQVNPNAKLVVCGMTATDASIGDPNDKGILNIAGFDSNLPKIISEFVKGF